eukprot:jgi/Botrbrau1/15795/Bobra.4_1s0146.1
MWLDLWVLNPSSDPFLNSIIKGAKVHKGFYTQLVDMFPELKDKINKLLEKAGVQPQELQRIFVTGHSLGGALATIGACLLSKEYTDADVSVVTFASPRPGNVQFAQAYRYLIGDSLRFIFNYDLIPAMPSKRWWAHVDQCMWLKPRNPPRWTDGIDEGATLDRLSGRGPGAKLCIGKLTIQFANPLTANHSMHEHYIGSLVGFMRRLAKE